MSRLGVSVAPLILMLEDVWTPLPQIIICSMASVAGLVALLLPETLKERLPETIQDVEQNLRSPILQNPLLHVSSTSTCVPSV